VAAILGALTLGDDGGLGIVALASQGGLSVSALDLSSGWISFAAESDAQLTVVSQDQSYYEDLVFEGWIRIDGQTVVGPFEDYFLVDGNTLRLVAPALEGDFNGDGHVDAADYTIWADNYTGSGGTSGTPSTGDANGDGAVDTADYTIWADNYAGSQAAGAIPEPAVTSLCPGLIVLLAFRRLRRHSAVTR
jgi:hypothetical protein